MSYHKEEIIQITNRHIAKILNKLDEINTPEIAKEAVKQQMWYLSNDLRDELTGGKNGLGF